MAEQNTKIQRNYFKAFNELMSDFQKLRLCCKDFISSIFTENSESVTLTGDGTKDNPLQANIAISATTGNTLVLNPDGFFSPGNSLAVNTIPVVLTDGAIVTWDFSLSSVAKVTIGGNRTLAITNIFPGSIGMLILVQDATGTRTLTLPSVSKKDSLYGTSVSANAIDILNFYYDGTTFYWTSSKNFA